MVKSNKALEKGDLVLITGGTGWVGSHIVEKAIEQGLRVRMAIRDEQKSNRLIKALKEKHGQGIHIETVLVTDFSKEGAYDEAVKGVQGITHSASNLSFSDQYDEVVPPTIKSYEILLKAAHSCGNDIKRVVITSSSVALGFPATNPNDSQQNWNINTWNEFSVKRSKEKPNAWDVYAASKVLSEKFARDFVSEHKCDFILNVVNPNACLGRKVVGTDYMSTGTWIRRACLEANEELIKMVPSQYHVDVDDVGLLHVLALTQEDIVNERILAFGERFTWDKMFELAKKYSPEKFNPAPKNQNTAQMDNTIVDLSRTQEILKPFGGIKSLEHSVQLNLQD